MFETKSLGEKTRNSLKYDDNRFCIWQNSLMYFSDYGGCDYNKFDGSLMSCSYNTLIFLANFECDKQVSGNFVEKRGMKATFAPGIIYRYFA